MSDWPNFRLVAGGPRCAYCTLPRPIGTARIPAIHHNSTTSELDSIGLIQDNACFVPPDVKTVRYISWSMTAIRTHTVLDKVLALQDIP
jgi:hypothetical protein